MMFRIRDEEESIQQLVVESFRERWFAGDVASQDRRAHELMLVVWQVRAPWRCCASPKRDRQTSRSIHHRVDAFRLPVLRKGRTRTK